MNVRRLFSSALIVSTLALGLVAPAWAVNHNPAQSGPDYSESDISFGSVTATINSDGTVSAKIEIKEKNTKNDGGLSVRPAIVRFYDKKGKQEGGDEEGKEGSNTYTVSQN